MSTATLPFDPPLPQVPTPRATYYWLDDYTDETCPCQPTLEAWAKWLADPQGEWGRSAPAAEGEVFLCHGSTRRDAVATFSNGAWCFDGEAWDWGVVIEAPGLWDSEAIFPDAASAQDTLSDFSDRFPGPEEGDVQDVALMTDMPPMRFEFRTVDGVPTLKLMGLHQ